MRWVNRFLLPLFMILMVGCASNSEENVYSAVVEGKTIQVPALTGGKILSLAVKQGETVNRDDILAVVDTSELVLQLSQIRASLEEVNVQEELARSNLKQAETNFNYVRDKRNRILELFRKNSASQQSVDDIEHQYQQAEIALQTARQKLLAVKAQRERLQAQQKLVEKKLDDAFIRAPISGVISEVYYESGEAVPPLSPVVELLYLAEVEVNIFVSEKTLPQLKYGQEVTVRVDGRDESLTGKITWISDKAEFTPKTILTPETRTSLVYQVKVMVPNASLVLKHGMPVEVVL
ncbi:MAG: HlyD family efflux transporter periplasmic adaptor subunit [Calditrichaeota bacterium]|nr:MAG: HlyD family efflux transporter periplasmic adaptor subunit [Calditrichota bacterium]